MCSYIKSINVMDRELYVDIWAMVFWPWGKASKIYIISYNPSSPSYFRTWFKLASHAVTNTSAEKWRCRCLDCQLACILQEQGEKTEASILSMVVNLCVYICISTHKNIPLSPLQVWFKCWNLVTLSTRRNTFITEVPKLVVTFLDVL